MRRGIAGALGVSVGVHAAAFAALALAPQTRQRDAAAGAGSGADLVFVDLLRVQSGAPPGAGRAPAPAPQRAPLSGAEPTLALASSVEREPTSSGSAHAGDPPIRGERESTSSGNAHRGEAPIRGEPAGATARATARASSHLSRVARPASEIRPLYPDSARERGDEAEVIVEAWVSASGRVEDARIRSSAGNAFDSAALDAVLRARFHPASRDGEPVASWVAMRLHFTLGR